MFPLRITRFKITTGDNLIYHLLLLFGALLPLQFALNPAEGFDLAIVRIVIPLMWLLGLMIAIKNKELFYVRDKITFLLLIFLAFASFSLLFSHNLFWSLRKLFFLYSIVPLYFIALPILNSKLRRRRLITALVGGATLLAFLAILQFAAQFVFGIESVYNFLASNITPFFLGHSFSQTVLSYPSWLVNASGTTYMRATAIFPDPHMLSYYLGMMLPWSIALWSTSDKHRNLFFFSSIFLLIADICTFTRGGYIALIVGALVILPLVSRSSIKKIFAGAVVLLFLFVLAPHGPVAGRLTSSFDVNEGSNQGRLSNWQAALTIIKSHPFGVGIGMYSLTVDSNANYREPIYAHDLYLDLAAELGIQTAILFILIIFFSLAYFWRAAKADSFMIAGVSSIVIFASHSLVETPLYSVHVLSLFCIIIALSVSTKQYGEE
jgi:O-antigen ligase